MAQEIRAPAPPIEPGGPRPATGRLRRLLSRFLGLLLIGLAAGGLWLYLELRASLPQLEGVQEVRGLEAPVRIERDHLGVPTIRGANRSDVARALGFLHGQERFFQMDLMRRRAAGELSEILGAGTLSVDRRNRVHRFRTRAGRVLEVLPSPDRQILDAYATGVNAGLRALRARPFEYLLLALEPEPWLIDDTILTIYAMYLELNDETGRRESVRGLLHEILGPEMYEFLAPRGTEWDVPIIGEPLETPPVPGPEVLAARGRNSHSYQGLADLEANLAIVRGTPTLEGSREVSAGSNNWALAGRFTRHGGALLANDMHLGHSVPNIWYRASLVYPAPDNPTAERRVTGITLPGTPLIVVGSNGRIAWGFTNTYGDWEDLVVLEPATKGGEGYLTPDGPRAFEVHQESLRIKGEQQETLEVLETIWGPVIDRDYRDRRRALRWIAHDPQGVTMRMLDLEGAANIDEAIEIANRIGAPPQNFVVADAEGRIGWTVMGAIPRRFGHDGRLPSSWADGNRGWDGWLEPAEYPRILDPEEGRLWSANNRVVDGEQLAKIGLGDYLLGARARQIRDDLRALERATEADLLSIQLDDRALFLERWRQLLLQVLTPEALAADPRRQELRRHVEEWSGRAAVESVGYRMVRAFRLFLAEQVFDSLTSACKEADSRFDYDHINQMEGPLWRLATERPEHLLAPRFDSWNQQFLSAVDATLDYFLEDGGSLAQKTWGDRNTSSIRHPLSSSLPGVGRWLDMPRTPLPGGSDMPRYQAPADGASERMVVSPGHEDQGIFHMPGGQSGHPLSPNYRDGHRAWVRGEPTPFLPGPTVHTLVLRPTGS